MCFLLNIFLYCLYASKLHYKKKERRTLQGPPPHGYRPSTQSLRLFPCCQSLPALYPDSFFLPLFSVFVEIRLGADLCLPNEVETLPINLPLPLDQSNFLCRKLPTPRGLILPSSAPAMPTPWTASSLSVVGTFF